MSEKHPEIVIVGSGAMGALFGSILFENGRKVILYDINSEHVQAIQQNGLQIEGYGGNRTVPIKATTDLGHLESSDILIFQCKAHGTRDAARAVKHLVRKHSVCISFQNGLGNEEVISEELGKDFVLGGLTAMAAVLLAPGKLMDFSRVPSYIGEMEGKTSSRSETIAALLSNAGLETHVSENIPKEIWKKLLGNISMSALSGLTDLTSASVNSVPELRAISLQAMEEALDVSDACGIGLERESIIQGIAMISKPGGTGDNKSSLCVDLLHGRKTEVDFIYGSVIQIAEKKQIPTPTLKVLHGLVKGVEARNKNML